MNCHTHICFGGNRANDFAMRNAGKLTSKLQKKVAEFGVQCSTYQKCFRKELFRKLLERINRLISLGITTIEIKSGYGLNIENELKMLRVIKKHKKNQGNTCPNLSFCTPKTKRFLKELLQHICNIF